MRMFLLGVNTLAYFWGISGGWKHYEQYANHQFIQHTVGFQYVYEHAPTSSAPPYLSLPAALNSRHR